MAFNMTMSFSSPLGHWDYFASARFDQKGFIKREEMGTWPCWSRYKTSPSIPPACRRSHFRAMCPNRLKVVAELAMFRRTNTYFLGPFPHSYLLYRRFRTCDKVALAHGGSLDRKERLYGTAVWTEAWNVR